MNWGLGIVLGLGAFMLFIIGSVIYMTNKNTDTLDDQDYYERGLNYDEIYVLRENLQQDHAKPTLRITPDTLSIQFIKADNKGDMIWKRPSDGAMDKSIPFLTRTGIFKLPLTSFSKGSWKLELRWHSDGKEYISEHNVFVQ